MGHTVVSSFVSLDGVREAPGGELGHRRTGKISGSLADAWPTYESDFADRTTQIPGLVISTTPRSLESQNTTLLAGDFVEAIEASMLSLTGVKAMPNGTVLFACVPTRQLPGIDA